jgi:hypothetical protein
MRVVRLAVVVALLVTAGCSGHAQPARLSAMNRAAARYLAIARPANRRLDEAVDGYRDARRDDLARARAELRRQATVEQHFDRQLARASMPRVPAGIARTLIRANRARIRLTREQARSASLAEMRSFDTGHRAADAAVEVQVKAIRNVLGLPPPPE